MCQIWVEQRLSAALSRFTIAVSAADVASHFFSQSEQKSQSDTPRQNGLLIGQKSRTAGLRPGLYYRLKCRAEALLDPKPAPPKALLHPKPWSTRRRILNHFGWQLRFGLSAQGNLSRAWSLLQRINR
jgi:hypothetical protein